MKKTIGILIFSLLPFFAMAQADPIDALFEKYAGKDGFTSVYISQNLFKLIGSIETDDREAGEVLKNLSRVRVLAQEEEVAGVTNFFKELQGYPFKDFEELMVVREKDQDVRILSKSKDGKITHLLVIVGGSDDNAVISIEGLIDLNTISKLSKNMGGHMGSLERLNDREW